jgi:hypothetical protein
VQSGTGPEYAHGYNSYRMPAALQRCAASQAAAGGGGGGGGGVATQAAALNIVPHFDFQRRTSYPFRKCIANAVPRSDPAVPSQPTLQLARDGTGGVDVSPNDWRAQASVKPAMTGSFFSAGVLSPDLALPLLVVDDAGDQPVFDIATDGRLHLAAESDGLGRRDFFGEVFGLL